MMECEQYQEMCSAYLDDELNTGEQADLQAHLSACPACEAYMDSLRTVRR